MPWPVNFRRSENCAYVMCEAGGHSVCFHFGQYYERLCEAAQKAIQDPTPANLDSLREVMKEEVSVVHD